MGDAMTLVTLFSALSGAGGVPYTANPTRCISLVPRSVPAYSQWAVRMGMLYESGMNPAAP